MSPPAPHHCTVSALLKWRAGRISEEGGEISQGLPARWLAAEPRLYRCTGGHVASVTLPEALCIACHRRTILTFPEDGDYT